jgi:hypothetical protein
MRAGRQMHLHSGKHQRALHSHALQRAPLQCVPSGGRLMLLWKRGSCFEGTFRQTHSLCDGERGMRVRTECICA